MPEETVGIASKLMDSSPDGPSHFCRYARRDLFGIRLIGEEPPYVVILEAACEVALGSSKAAHRRRDALPGIYIPGPIVVESPRHSRE
jgi:hypothetical protein